MRKIISFFTLIILFSCQNTENKFEEPSRNYKSTHPTEKINEHKDNLNQEPIVEPITWKEIKIENFSFKLPEKFEYQSAYSTRNNKVYSNEESAVTVLFDRLPQEKENSNVYEVIYDIEEYGRSVNQEQKKHFSDIQLIKSEKSKIGNNNSILVSQKSTKISGNNTTMLIQAHYCIFSPYFISITATYPLNSSDQKKIIEEVLNSFVFID